MLSQEEIAVLSERHDEGYIMTPEEREAELHGIRCTCNHWSFKDWSGWDDFDMFFWGDFDSYQESRLREESENERKE